MIMLVLGKDLEDYLKVIWVGPDAQLEMKKPTMTVLKSPDKKEANESESFDYSCKTKHLHGTLSLRILSKKMKLS